MNRSSSVTVRRKRIFHRRMIKFTFALAAVIIMAAGFGSIKSFAHSEASEKSANTSYKYFTSIQVKDGDTISAIARSHMSDEYDSVDAYIAEVAAINHLDEDCHITTGSHIIVPYYSVMKK